MKVAIRNKNEMKYIETEKLEVGDISLLELYNVVYKQNKIIAELLDTLKEKHIVNKDTDYIIKIENKLYQVDQLELVAAQDLKYPLNYYTIENGQIKLDRKKVVTL
jgi:hypothetical protein